MMAVACEIDDTCKGCVDERDFALVQSVEWPRPLAIVSKLNAACGGARGTVIAFHYS